MQGLLRRYSHMLGSESEESAMGCSPECEPTWSGVFVETLVLYGDLQDS